MKKSLLKVILSFLLIFSLHFSLFAQQLTVDVLVVSGGGSGGAGYGGGGGGGAVKYFTSQTVSDAKTVIVGAGGAAVNITTNGTTVAGNPGESSSFGSLVATSSSTANGPNSAGGGGGGAGSGGGAGGNFNTTSISGGTAVSDMGNNGGNSAGNGRNFSNVCGGGGGGAGAVGGLGGTNTSPANRGGAGGAGISNSISGVAVFYGGGGGGGVTFNGNAGGAGGNGGGGAGSKGDVAATNGTANTGGGGGGFGASNGGASNNYSGAGGSGVVIVRYLGNTILASGGTITQVGGYTIHTFNTSGTFALPCNANTGDTTASACGSFVWYGVTYTSSATPTRTFTNVGGCDSVVTLHLTINNANTGDTTASACGSFVWYGVTYTSSATPTRTFTNVGGCDSVVTLHLTINALPTPTFTSSPSTTCLNSDVTYTTQSGQASYSWMVAGTAGVDYSITSGGLGSSSNTVTLKWLTAGSKNVSVNYTDQNGCTGGGIDIPTNGLVGYWPFTGNANDATAGGHNGDLRGTTLPALITDRHGNTNSAYAFTAGGTIPNHIYVGRNVLSNYSQMAVSLWFKTGSTTLSLPLSSGNNNEYNIQINPNGKIATGTFHCNNGTVTNGGYVSTESINAYNDNSWHHAVLVYDGSYNKLYVDGVFNSQVQNTSGTTTPGCASNANYSDLSFSSYYLYGDYYPLSSTEDLDDIAIYNRALSANEVADLYNAQNSEIIGGALSTTTVSIANTSDTTATACGSFVWYGVTYTSSATPTRTFTNVNGCDSVVTLHLTINSFPTAPTGTDAARCGTGTVGLLASGTGTIKWYNASTGGTLLGSGNSYTTPSISSTTIYYAMDSIVATGCVSATRTAVTATVNQLPAVPDVTNASRCGAGTVTLSATSAAGTVIDWSSDVRYIRYSCTNSSDGGQANLQELQAYRNGVNIALNKPGNSNSDYFSNSYLSVNDGNINSRWSSNRNNPGPASVLNPHYVEIDLGDNYIVDSITLFGDQYFNYNYILSVSGDANSWSSIGQGNLNSTPITYRMITTPLLTASNTFTTPSISATTSYYVVARDMVTGCVSATRTAVTATVIPLPAKPVVTNGSACTGNAVTLNATSTSGTVVDWYQTLSSTTPLLSASNTFTTPSISSSTSYYVEARDVTTGCLSSQGSVNNNIALNLDGNNDIVNLPMPALNSFTIEYWVKSTQASPSGSQWYSGNGIVDAEVGGGTTDFGTALLNDKLAFGVGDPDVTIFSTTSINTGSWNHVAATWDGSTGLMKLYINGTLEASANGATGLRSAPSAIRIGNLLPNINNFNGTIDELRIWNVVRTQSQIQENINNELNQQSGLVEAYHFNQGVAGGSNSGITTITDASGNNSNGSMNNFTLSGTSSNFVQGNLLRNSRTVVTANIKTRTTSTDTVAACVSYTWNGVTYSTSGTKTWRGTNAAGCDSVATLVLTISTSNLYPPFGVTQTAVSNVCSARVYRYTASVRAAGTTYNWILPTSIGGVSGVTVDSGDINSSRTLLVRYASNEAAFATDVIKVRSFNGCASNYTAVKLNNIKLAVPNAPGFITVTNIGANNCSNRTYRFTAPSLPAGTNSSNSTILPATGYLWSLIGNLSEYATIDSGDENSQKIVVSFSSNIAATIGDSIKLQYLSSCGNSLPKALKLSNTKLNVPLAPATITITALQTNVCGARRYRYTAPNLTASSTTYGAATGYVWSLVGSLSGTATVDSGDINSRVITVTFSSNASAATGDSIRLYYTSDCGNGARKASKLTNTLLGAPSAPATITIQTKSDVCNARTYRYIAPAVLPVATTTIAAASGYLWSAPTGNAGSTGTIDSGEVNSRIITVTYSSNAAAGVGDSIRLRYTSGCGNGAIKAQKLSNLVKNGCTPIAKNVSTSRTSKSLPTSFEVNVYPNPTTNQFNVQVKSAGTEEVVVRVLDLTGRFIKSIKVSSNSNLSLGSDLKAGAYMLEVKQSKEVKMVRVVKF